MNKYVRALVVIPTGLIKTAWLKVFHFNNFKGVQLAQISPYSEITLDGGRLQIGTDFKMRDGAKIRIRKGAECIIGKNTSINSFNMIACHERIVIGDNVELSPNVQIYDHDHDFRAEGGIKTKKYKTSPVIIGNNVWIGANTTILRGTTIGDNAVIGAGCVVKGEVLKDTILTQKHESLNREINQG